MSGKFNFFVGFDEETEDILKSSSKYDGNKKYNNMIVSGLASDNTEDLQGEILEPSGYDIEDFLSNGLINLEHYTTRKGDPSFWIGEPIDAHIKSDEFFIKSKLWKDHPKARSFWDTLLVMKSSGSTRKAGYSIEGTKKQVDPKNKKRIVKAKINHSAVTFSPVNKNSWIDISKGMQVDDFIEVIPEGFINGGEYLLQFEKDGQVITVNKDYSVSIKPKAMDTNSLDPLLKESLRKKVFRLEDFNTIMKGIKSGMLKKEFLPYILKKVNKSFKLG